MDLKAVGILQRADPNEVLILDMVHQAQDHEKVEEDSAFVNVSTKFKWSLGI